MYNALAILFLIAEIATIGAIAVITYLMYRKHKTVLSKKSLWYLIPSFALIYLLGLTARFYSGVKVDFFVCFDLVNTTFDVFGFQTDDYVIEICKNGIFYADFVIAYLLAVVTVVTSVLGLFGLRIHNWSVRRAAYKKGCDLVLGDSDSACEYLKANPGSVMLAPKMPRKRYIELLKSGIAVHRIELSDGKLAKKVQKNDFEIIVFRAGGYPYSKIIDEFSELRQHGGRAELHLEATLDETKIIRQKFIGKAGKGIEPHIRCFNKYELIARKFVTDYPVTKYIPRDFYNKNFSIKENKDINIVFVGFGKVNYQLFRMFAMQFQFASEKDGKLCSKPVHYYIYDNNESALSNEFRSRIEFEFDDIFSNCDFPKPEDICDMNVENIDINSCEAKKQFKSLVGKNSYTYFIVSLDDDLKDAAYAQTVRRLFDDGNNYKIFVRAKNRNGETLNVDTDSVIYFGDDGSLYTHDSIVNDVLSETARRLNLLYEMAKSEDKESEKQKDEEQPQETEKPQDEEQQRNGEQPQENEQQQNGEQSQESEKQKERESAEDKEKKRLIAEKRAEWAQCKSLDEFLEKPENRKFMLYLWSGLEMIQQSSNLYRALNIPFKLEMLGYEMVERGGGVTEKQFFNRYAGTDSAEETNKKYDDYSVYFKTEPCNVLAYIEHSRWNALYILYDYRQMSKAEIEKLNGIDEGKTVSEVKHKDTKKLKHACLTTYYGLDDLIKYKFGLIYGKTEAQKVKDKDARLLALSDIYKYDYIDLNSLYSSVLTLGYTVKDKLNTAAHSSRDADYVRQAASVM